MSKSYNVIEHENSKYYKEIPYITRKELKKNQNNIVIGCTKLKKYKSNSEKKELDLLYFKNEKYEVKTKMLGFNKGYVFVGNNSYITLKYCIPFFFILLLLLLIFGLLIIFNKNDTLPIKNPINFPETKIFPDNNKDSVEDKKKEDDPYKYVPNRKKVEEAKGIKYYISFDSNDGSGTIASITCKGNEVCKLPKNSMTKEGYIFTGWSTEKNGEPIYLDEMDVFNLTTKDNENIILYAMWKIETYNVEFFDYDGSVISKSKYDYGESVIAPENPKRLGYTFSKWDNDIVNEVKTDLTYNALYDVNNYEISYNLSGGAFEDNAPLTYTVEDDLFDIPKPSKKGYTFLGWTDDKTKEPIIDYKINQGTIGNIKLLANYKPNSYKLIYNTNGAREQISPKKINFDEIYGELPTISKKGYKLINWTDENNNEVSSKNVFNEDKDITISANWEIIKYDITYNLVGGVIEDNPLNYNVEENIILPNPVKEGYIFLGWTSKNDDEPKINYEIKKGSTGNLKLTANYKPISYSIIYNSLSGTGKT